MPSLQDLYYPPPPGCLNFGDRVTDGNTHAMVVSAMGGRLATLVDLSTGVEISLAGKVISDGHLTAVGAKELFKNELSKWWIERRAGEPDISVTTKHGVHECRCGNSQWKISETTLKEQS